jgi:hypothetical protein
MIRPRKKSKDNSRREAGNVGCVTVMLNFLISDLYFLDEDIKCK